MVSEIKVFSDKNKIFESFFCTSILNLDRSEIDINGSFEIGIDFIILFMYGIFRS